MWKLVPFLVVIVFSVQGQSAVLQAPQLSAHQESVKVKAAPGVAGAPLSRVTITVGEKNGFAYTVNGVTNSPYRIAVSGDYYNDDVSRNGYARLYLVAEPNAAEYWLQERGNILDVKIFNGYGAEFDYEIICPAPVNTRMLYEGQVNQTAVLITGPSRSMVW